MAERPPGKVIVVMPALNAARTLERTVEAIPREWVDEIVLVDDASSDDTVELARSLPLHVVWHPHNAGYGANQKTCYLEALQRDADAIVMLHPDGQYEPRADRQPGRADPGGACRSRARLAPRAAGHGARERHAALEVRGEPRADGDREPDHGHAALRGPHGLPRLLAAAAPDRPVPAQLGRLRLRLGAADAGLTLRHADPGGSRPRPLLRGRVVGRPGQRHRLRPEDALDRDAARAAPRADRAVTEVQAPDARRSTRVEPRGHGRAGRHLARRLQSHLAAPRGRLCAERAATSSPGACSTWAAGSATATGCSPRARPSGSTSTRRRSRGSSGRRWPRTCADCPSRPASFDGAIAVHSIEHVPDPERALAEIARVLKPGATAVLVTPNRLTFARADEIIDPYHYVEYDRARARGAVRAVLRERRDGRDLRLRALPARSWRASTRSSTGCSGSTRCGCGAWYRAAARQALYDRRLSRERSGDDPDAAAITADDFTLATEGLDDCPRSGRGLPEVAPIDWLAGRWSRPGRRSIRT